ncbi:MAG TPA: hypothetical protein VEI02_16750 [Planctomycetota bacterium]|nr:hypothetical protein [Planctomycetota bacterium]
MKLSKTWLAALLAAATTAAGAQDTSIPGTLSVDQQPSGWTVTLEDAQPGAPTFLFIGLPNPSGATFLLDLGFYGSLGMDIAYPDAVVELGVAGGDGLISAFFSRPASLPPELIGFTLALQAVEVTWELFLPPIPGGGATDAAGPYHVRMTYRKSTVAELVVQ